MSGVVITRSADGTERDCGLRFLTGEAEENMSDED